MDGGGGGSNPNERHPSTCLVRGFRVPRRAQPCFVFVPVLPPPIHLRHRFGWASDMSTAGSSRQTWSSRFGKRSRYPLVNLGSPAPKYCSVSCKEPALGPVSNRSTFWSVMHQNSFAGRSG